MREYFQSDLNDKVLVFIVVTLCFLGITQIADGFYWVYKSVRIEVNLIEEQK